MTVKVALWVTLLVACFVMVTSASEGKLEIKRLTEETLGEELGFGNWLILYCGTEKNKCEEGERVLQELALWPKVANLASLDCSIYEDVCLDYGVGEKNYPTFILHSEPKDKLVLHSGKEANTEKIYTKAYFRLNGIQIQLFNEHFIDNYPSEIARPEKKTDPKWKIRNFADNDLPFFVLYYNTWCMHSKLFLQGVWKDMAIHLKKIANVAKVDCTAEAALCQKQGIKVTPTVKLYHDGDTFTFDRERSFNVFLSEWAPENLVDFYNEHTHSSIPYPVREPPPHYRNAQSDIV